MNEFIYNLSYRDILSLPRKFKEDCLKRFNELVKDIPDSIYEEYKTLYDMLLEMELLSESEVSNYVFSGLVVKYYPNIIYRKVLKPFTCPVSGEVMSYGSEQAIWKPLIYLPKRRERYSLEKLIHVHYYYSDFFPTDVTSLDDFFYKVENSYDLNLEEYYNFYCNVGSLKLRRFKKNTH